MARVNSPSPGDLAEDKHQVSQALYQKIDWQGYVRAGQFLSDEEFRLLECAQENLDFVIESRELLSTNETQIKAFARVLLALVRNITSNRDVQQYAFTRMEEVLGLNPAEHALSDHIFSKRRARNFGNENGILDTEIFMTAIRNGDQKIQKSASMALACLLTECDGDLEGLTSWMCDQIASSGAADSAVQAAVPALCMLMRKPAARLVFAQHGGVGIITGQMFKLATDTNAQRMYECCFCLWSLTLEETTHPDFLVNGTIRALIEQLTAAPSRKVVRMSLAALRNLASLEKDDILTEMLTWGLEKILSNFMHANAHKQANDPEVESDCKELYETLMRNYRDLSTFDRWMAEVSSGVLRWGIVHTEKFWRENASLLEQNDFKPLKKLVNVLKTARKTDDTQILSIVLYDIGEFSRFYTNGRVILRTLGAKDMVMELIGHPSEEIQAQALQCASKIMVTNWEFMR